MKKTLFETAKAISEEVAEFKISLSAEEIVDFVKKGEITQEEIEKNGAIPVLEYMGAGIRSSDFE